MISEEYEGLLIRKAFDNSFYFLGAFTAAWTMVSVPGFAVLYSLLNPLPLREEFWEKGKTGLEGRLS